MPETTAAAEDRKRGMCVSQCETSSATSVLPSGSARIEPSTIRMATSDSSANSRSVGRRTRAASGAAGGGPVAPGALLVFPERVTWSAALLAFGTPSPGR